MRRTDQRRAAVFALYQFDLTGRAIEVTLGDSPSRFTRELAEGALARREEIDALIAGHAKGWALDRIAPLERNILRIALYEMLARVDVPAEVAIDQAVEIAKRYCSSEAPAFVNGILGTVARDLVKQS